MDIFLHFILSNLSEILESWFMSVFFFYDTLRVDAFKNSLINFSFHLQISPL